MQKRSSTYSALRCHRHDNTTSDRKRVGQEKGPHTSKPPAGVAVTCALLQWRTHVIVSINTGASVLHRLAPHLRPRHVQACPCRAFILQQPFIRSNSYHLHCIGNRLQHVHACTCAPVRQRITGPVPYLGRHRVVGTSGWHESFDKWHSTTYRLPSSFSY